MMINHLTRQVSLVTEARSSFSASLPFELLTLSLQAGLTEVEHADPLALQKHELP